MSKPNVQAKTVSQLKIPGTRGSVAYPLEKALSQISYGGMGFLWDLKKEKAPTDKDLLEAPYHIGPHAPRRFPNSTI
jgi:hypothetical protein